MKEETLEAGAAQRVITPPVGVSLTGWNPRSMGDIRSRFVHDDLYAKALVLKQGDRAWCLIAVDLTGVDAVATGEIRSGLAERTGLDSEAVMVCATHTHSGPAVCPVATTYSPEEMARFTVGGDGKAPEGMGTVTKVSSSANWVGETDLEWKARFVSLAVEAGAESWQSLRPAAVGFGEAEVEGVASSRRRLLSDGSWADPRRESDPALEVVSQTEIDPMVRTIAVKDAGDGTPLACVLTYGSHPWVFCGAGISAELAGATSTKVAAEWGEEGAEPPLVLYTSGPEGDVSLIWNIDMDGVWRVRPEETSEESQERRQKGFDRELDRLSGVLADGVMRAIRSVRGWDLAPEVRALRQEVVLPLKPGYSPRPGVLLADWQRAAPEGCHMTEVQVLQAGEGAILGLPGEPFASLGTAIRAGSPIPHLSITALTNDFGAICYIADREAYDQGGYEIAFSPVGRGGGEALVEGAMAALERPRGLLED